MKRPKISTYQNITIMKDYKYEGDEREIGQWWLAAIVGIVAIAVGFIVLVNPVASYFTAAVWLGAAIFVSGIMGLIISLTSNNILVRRGWAIFASIIDVIIGVMLMFNVLFTLSIMPIILGIWLLYRGATSLMQGLDLKRYDVRDSGWMIFGSVVMIAIAIIILWLPMTLGVEAVILFLALAFIVYGVSTLSYAFRLLDIHRRAKNMR